MTEQQSSSKWSEEVVRDKMRSLFGIESVEVYESSNEEGIWCFKIGFFPTRGQGYEETMKCCVRESGEVLWKHSHP